MAIHGVCYNCRKRGHYSTTSAGKSNCPKNINTVNPKKNVVHYLSGVILTQLGGDIINRNYLSGIVLTQLGGDVINKW